MAETRETRVNHPKHYTSHPSGVECITVTEHMSFNLGNAVKYIWRAGNKDATAIIEDLQKAAWYVNREIERLGNHGERDLAEDRLPQELCMKPWCRLGPPVVWPEFQTMSIIPCQLPKNHEGACSGESRRLL